MKLLKRSFSRSVFSLANDSDKDKLAVLSEQPHIREGGRWREIAIPAKLAGAAAARQQLRIFFGRDDQPRILGTRWSGNQIEQVYLRFRKGRWRKEPRELASFAGRPAAPLYGVLGLADPEVLCKMGRFCLIKQRSGWSQVPLPIEPPAAPQWVGLGADGAFALLPTQLLRLRKKRWEAAAGAGGWKGTPAGAWTSAADAWVSVPKEDALYHHDGKRWQRWPSPLKGPRGFWGDAAGRLWLAADGGAALRESGRWAIVGGIDGPVSEVVGHGDRVYIGGRSGVWEVQPPKANKP